MTEYNFAFPQLSLYSVKRISFNYQVFEIESFRWVDEFRVGGSVSRCSVGGWSMGKWLVGGWSVLGGFNKTIKGMASNKKKSFD